jgi:hypothetical protein
MRNYLIIIFYCFVAECAGQADSVNKESDQIYWTPRYSIGIQNSPFVEIGISKLGISNRGIEFGSWCFYGSAELNYRKQSDNNSNIFYGVKAGFETSWAFFMWALELKFVSDNKDAQLIFTPKLGLSVLGVVNILYGYNLPDKKLKFNGLGHHQISLIVNINRKIIKEGK